jgi:hypothetical protein
MANLIDREGLLERLCENCGTYGKCRYTCVDYDTIAQVPAVDAVPVVRCGECIHSTRSPFGHPVLRWCPAQDTHKRPDWFCADGRREKKR